MTTNKRVDFRPFYFFVTLVDSDIFLYAICSKYRMIFDKKAQLNFSIV